MAENVEIGSLSEILKDCKKSANYRVVQVFAGAVVVGTFFVLFHATVMPIHLIVRVVMMCVAAGMLTVGVFTVRATYRIPDECLNGLAALNWKDGAAKKQLQEKLKSEGYLVLRDLEVAYSAEKKARQLALAVVEPGAANFLR